jgi:hypothetical protein
MVVLGYAGGGELGNFGAVGVDQATFGPAVFFWFFVIGGLTVVMSGGITRRPKRVSAPEPEPEPLPGWDLTPDAEPNRWASRSSSRSATPNRTKKTTNCPTSPAPHRPSSNPN